MTKFKKGFTLIELLVVISIIGLLSSVVLASLSTARAKAKDSALIQMAKQLQTIMLMMYSDTGSYAGVQSNTWLIENATICNGNGINNMHVDYRNKVIEICNRIAELIPQTAPQKLYMGPVNGPASIVVGANTIPPVASINNSPQSFTIQVLLHTGALNSYYCIGHNGKSSIGQWNLGNVGWGRDGCFGDVTNK